MFADLEPILKHIFKKFTTDNGDVVYFRDCVLQEGEQEGEQGYLWVYPDGSYCHSYRTPDMLWKGFVE